MARPGAALRLASAAAADCHGGVASLAACTRRASSPRPSVRSDISARKSSTLSAAKKRLMFFASGSQTIAGATVKSEVKAAPKKNEEGQRAR